MPLGEQAVSMGEIHGSKERLAVARRSQAALGRSLTKRSPFIEPTLLRWRLAIAVLISENRVFNHIFC